MSGEGGDLGIARRLQHCDLREEEAPVSRPAEGETPASRPAEGDSPVLRPAGEGLWRGVTQEEEVLA